MWTIINFQRVRNARWRQCPSCIPFISLQVSTLWYHNAYFNCNDISSSLVFSASSISTLSIFFIFWTCNLCVFVHCIWLQLRWVFQCHNIASSCYALQHLPSSLLFPFPSFSLFSFTILVFIFVILFLYFFLLNWHYHCT